MSLARPYGVRTAAAASVSVADVRPPPQRADPRAPSAALTAALPRPLHSAGAEGRNGLLQKIQLGGDTISHVLQRELSNAALRTEAKGASVLAGENNDKNGNNTSNGNDIVKSDNNDVVQWVPLSRDEMRNALLMITAKQNSAFESRRISLLEQREQELLRCGRHHRKISTKLGNKSTEPICMLLHSLLGESRRKWRQMLSARVQTLKQSVHQVDGMPAVEVSSSEDGEDLEWSVEQLYGTLVEGLNSTTTEKLLVSRVFGGDASIFRDSIDSFGLLTVFRAPIQELLAQHETLVPSLTALRRWFAALHPSNGSPGAAAHTDPSIDDAERNLDALLQHGSTPEAVAKALRGCVSPSLRRLLYARALQLPLVVTDGTSLFGGRGELQANQHGHSIAGFLSFASKYCRDKIKRRMHHTYSTKEQETTSKVLQAVVKVDNSQCVGNSDKYFIFADEAELLALSLILDKSLSDVRLRNTLRQLGRPPEQLDSYLVFLQVSPTEGAAQQQQQHRTPPSGFFPVRTSALLIAPVCYITGDTVEQYDLLSALFGQLWCRLQGPTPELIQCCWIFEDLVARFAAPACLHATRTLHLPPLRLAIHWMLSAFVEVLEPAELLSFWDLILSYHVEEMFAEQTSISIPVEDGMSEKKKDSLCAPCALWLLPLLAAGLFVYRAPLVERCATAEEMLLVFKEGHHIRCRPLLQYLLYMAK
ncbi:TBC1 domain family, member 19 [Trypanosoma grayi]|uniref:TBC1 domain family, member 19 n=1 Tax=Trypanosoma grayi TaxID=71804 RepID=UPI0004F3F9B7|nr:TBC1 domain family, member 19 [Trypanosoma grayi]KEG11010.1 TBC1 domain family, member 19 [Trypanosoma grayi]